MPRVRNRTIVVLGLVLLAALAGVAQYLRVNYDVTGIVLSHFTDLVAIHTDRYEASSDEIDAMIQAARAVPGLAPAARPTRGPLEVDPQNPRYFRDGDGRTIYLAGSHTWSNFQDNDGSYPPPEFDFEQYLDFLEAHGHNLTRLWVWEVSRWSVHTADDDYWFYPESPFVRTGPGLALDGKPRWDLEQFDDAWFERLRARVAAAGERGIYGAVMLFNGWSVAGEVGGLSAGNPWHGHPMNAANNINGVDGDRNGDDSGQEVHELGNAEVLAIQHAYLKRVVDTLNDLDNVLYEISNESHLASVEWQHHVIDWLHEYQAGLPNQHPVGMSIPFPKGDNATLFASNADWIAPLRHRNPPPADGRKVIIADTDHLWGIGGNRAWAWKSLARGVQPIFMDGYDAASYGTGGKAFDWQDPVWSSLRINMGHTRRYAERMDLASARPDVEACSTGYCLVANGSRGPQYLVYAEAGGIVGIDLSDVAGELQVEWFSPATSETHRVGVVSGGAWRELAAPFDGDAVLFLDVPD